MRIPDEALRKMAIGVGIFSGVLFILSLVAAIEFPSLFKYLAISMILFSLLFLVLRSALNYRETFRVKKR